MAKVDITGLDLEGLNSLIEEAMKLRDAKVDEKRADLLKQLHALDALAKPSKSSATRVRSASTFTHKHPVSGHLWLGRGGVPKEWRDLIPDGTSKEERSAILSKHRVNL